MSPYFTSYYDTKERFCSYWHQIDEVLQLQPNTVLEVGIGNGFVTRYLRKKGTSVTTLDIDYDLVPDVTGSVLRLPFSDTSFDVVTCYEVLEHLPYADFSEALKELARVSRSYVLLSVPDLTTVYKFYLSLPRIRPIKKLIPHPYPRPISHIYDGQHYWEIGKRGYDLKRIKYDILRSSLRIIRTYRVFEMQYHRFFILAKIVTSP
jgi:ubiquinone/menaquinone biosynthesis C-methylase UbiE